MESEAGERVTQVLVEILLHTPLDTRPVNMAGLLFNTCLKTALMFKSFSVNSSIDVGGGHHMMRTSG